MHHHYAEILASILVAGVILQWVGWRLRIPGLILLILAGFIMGPATGWLDPSKDFGDMLQPMISLSVAVILFEGGLNLQWHEFRKNSRIIYRLVSLNVIISFMLASLTAHYLVGMDWPVALVLGSIIIVTGPTVIMPLLKQANLKNQPAALLRWEGIVNDPIGALLVVLIYGYYVYAESNSLITDVLGGLGLSLLVSLLLGVGSGVLLAKAFKRGMVPEYLKSPLILATVLLVYTLTNRVQGEAGLLATTILGITLANQKLDTLHELKRFKEYVTILLVSSTFIVLTADIDPAILLKLGWEGWTLIALLIFVIRPLSIYFSTIATGIKWQERLLLAWIAPRGIVAAAVAGLFGAQLVTKGYAGAELLLPIIFALILLTVLLHGLSIGWIARRLGLASDKPEGIILIGASPWSIELATTLQKYDIPVLLNDTSWKRLLPARMQNIPTHYGEILSERTEEVLELAHITKLVALTPNEAYNTLVCSRFAPELGHNNVREIGWQREKDSIEPTVSKIPSQAIRGYSAFGDKLFYDDFTQLYSEGWRFQSTRLSEKFSMPELLEQKPSELKVIGFIDQAKKVWFYPYRDDRQPEDDCVVITFVRE
ncbi:MAG: Na(+):H(+) antiporter [uncultured Thiotrichaceae bacterium]|uniref:Na(+):H(+) antiporter n=1 Tax=uncultured Thiotrichaceae bacterium TaxID=298394 RepID=A0A6S6SSG1_9GAMM|nr:MAG: Na(+):H(+) antiporter [uncultured Thiotrichaceae bacterium]